MCMKKGKKEKRKEKKKRKGKGKKGLQLLLMDAVLGI